jgi:hypothetical protein
MISVPPLRPRRPIDGISAVLLPFQADGRPTVSPRRRWSNGPGRPA